VSVTGVGRAGGGEVSRTTAAADCAEPSATPIRIEALDGYPLGATHYVPEGTPRAVVVINAATAVKRRYYDRFARYLTDDGFAVVTYDYRGVGDSRHAPLRKIEASMREWGELDQPAVLDYARRSEPTAPLMVIGHSVGGQILGLLRDPPRIARVLMVAAQHNYYGLWRMQERVVLWALWTLVMPVASRALGYFPGSLLALGEDLPRGVALEWARWCRAPGALVEVVGEDARERFARYDGPILALSFDDDYQFAPPRAVDALLRLYANARSSHRHLAAASLGLSRVGHFGFFREPARERGWPIARDWLAGGTP
jgi:predicted alpha/beta hydrolase